MHVSSSLLKLFTRFTFENNNWYIQDGDGKKNSSNGTWLLANEETFISNNLVLRAGNCAFQCFLKK